jgi:hypothetical protein
MATETATSEIRHRRETIRYVILPFALVLLVVIVCLVGVFLLPLRAQVSVVSDVMLTVLMLCPAVVCMLPLAILMVSGVFAMNRAHDAAANPLRRLQAMSARLAARAESTGDTVNQQTIGLSSRLGGLYRFTAVLESDEGDDDD